MEGGSCAILRPEAVMHFERREFREPVRNYTGNQETLHMGPSGFIWEMPNVQHLSANTQLKPFYGTECMPQHRLQGGATEQLGATRASCRQDSQSQPDPLSHPDPLSPNHRAVYRRQATSHASVSLALGEGRN